MAVTNGASDRPGPSQAEMHESRREDGSIVAPDAIRHYWQALRRHLAPGAVAAGDRLIDKPWSHSGAALPRQKTAFLEALLDGADHVPLKGGPFRFRQIYDIAVQLDEILCSVQYNFDTDVEAPFVIDAGGCYGLATYYLKRRFPKARIVAFEPDPDSAAIFRENIETIGMTDVDLRQEAVGARNAEATFYALPGMPMGSSTSRRLLEKGRPVSEITVRQIDLAAVIGDRRVDFLKLDVEGAEYDILDALDGRMAGIRNLFIELHFGADLPKSRLAGLLSVLDRNGFDFMITRAVAANPSPPQPLTRPADLIWSKSLNLWARPITQPVVAQPDVAQPGDTESACSTRPTGSRWPSSRLSREHLQGRQRIMRRFNTWARGLDKKYETEGHAAHDAATRLTTGKFLELEHHPKFTFPRDKAFYMIGSCFAREIEKAFLKENMTVLSRVGRLPDTAQEMAEGDSNAIMTKFTTHSMLAELEQAIGGGAELPDHGLIEVSPGRFYNPQLHRLRTLGLEDALAVQDIVRQSVKQIQDADVVFITLGLTESWWDDKLDVPLNVPPLHFRFPGAKERFRFINTDFAENLKSTERLIRLIRETSRKDVKIILTVSPVPLNHTFTEQDIIVANAYSKATLRSVAQEIVLKSDFVDYFPSYELVTYSPQALAWRHDQRHVTNEMVHHVISTFLSSYIPQPAATEETPA